MSNNKFLILAIFLVVFMSFSAVCAADNATSDIVCVEEAYVTEQITAEEMGYEGTVATSPELQNSTLNPDSTLNSDENPDDDFIDMQNEDSDVQSNSIDSGNLLTDEILTAQSTNGLYGIVDLGSNVMSLNIIKEENGELEFILSDNRESITATYKENNSLTQEGIDRLIMLLNEFEGIMDSNNVTVRYFFATASLRKLDNCGEVFTIVKNNMGIDLQILSEKDEAQAGFDAVKFIDLTDDDGILIDIGGGSCQVVAFTDMNPVSMESMPIGSRSCYEDYVSSMFPNETEILNIQNRVEMQLGKLRANNSGPVDDLYGIGGTLFNVRQILIYLGDIDNETYVVPLSTLDALLAKLLENTTECYRIISEVAPDRINTLIPGIVMARQISNHFHVNTIHFCKSRIEEGIVFELIYNYTLSSGTFQELQDEIDAAAEGGTIYLRKNYVYDGDFFGEGINITKAITIEGNGFEIDASGFSRIFNINATKNVVLNNIIFKNGLAMDGGAIIFNNNISDCIISNCGFLANIAFGDGGALYFKANADVTIENTIFNFNSAGNNGGAIYYLDVSDSDTFRNTQFLNNYAELGDGGAINFFRNLTNGIFDNVTFMNNVGGNGGAINVDGSTKSNSFNRTSFISNAARNNGGALYVLYFSDSDTFKNVLFGDNVARTKNGGAINYNRPVMNGLFDNVTFANNNASADAGALYFKDKITNVTIKDTTFENNGAQKNGGAIYVYGASDSCTFENTVFLNNVAETQDGGAINFFRNLTNGVFDNVTFMNNTGSNGGAINVDRNTSSNLFNCTRFINNTARLNGGAFYVLYHSTSDTFKNVSFISNFAINKDGGAINFHQNVANDVFDNCTFKYNYGRNGGAVNIDGGSTRNSFNNIQFLDNVADENGGAFYILKESNSDTFKDLLFANNVATTKDGGAINFHLALLDGVFDNVTFINNTGRNGGAVNMDRTVESILFNDIRFIDNVASDNGGAFYVLYPINLVIFNNTFFINNVAETEDGGAINFHGVSSNVTFDNVVFRNNSGRNGGAIYANSDVVNTKITNSEFKDNFADSATNNMAINGDGAFILENVDPENLGPFYVAYLTINITDSIVYGETLQIIAIVEKEDQNPLNAGIVSISVNGKNQTANVENGTAKFTISNLNAGSYNCVASYYNGVNYTNPTQSAEFTVSRQIATIAAKNAAYVINYNGKYSAVLKDTNGKPLAGKKVTFTLNGKNIGFASTNVNGIATVTLSAKILKAAKSGNKNLLIECSDLNYAAVSKTVKITINKEKTKLAAKTVKFKKAKKVKKYAVTLKANGKAVKGVKVTLKIKGKTYNAKTNKKGKAIFKIKNLKKGGTYKATVKFAGNNYYNKATKKVKITIK